MHLFDIIGPIMIGPSSSHTAGAARIGLVARELLKETPVCARIGLYGSFADTYKGHGTDRALLAGILGMRVDDERLRDSLSMAQEAGLSYEFYPVELSEAHPNTAFIELWAESGAYISMQAASVGGGMIRVDRMNGLKVSFSLVKDTLVLSHRDERGVIAAVSGLLAADEVNIATMQVFRDYEGGRAAMVIELDTVPECEILDAFRALPSVQSVTLLRKQV